MMARLAAYYDAGGLKVGDPEAEERERLAAEARDSDEGIAKVALLQAQAAKIAAETAEQKRRTQWAGGTPPPNADSYKNGGPVIRGEFKHANPTYAAYAKDGDGSLLAKGRK
jgi:hypothetical protein